MIVILHAQGCCSSVYHSLCKPPLKPCATAIFFPGDNVEGSGSARVDHLSRPEVIAALVEGKLRRISAKGRKEEQAGGAADGPPVLQDGTAQQEVGRQEQEQQQEKEKQLEQQVQQEREQEQGEQEQCFNIWVVYPSRSGEPMGYKPLGLPTAHRLLALLQQVARDVERQMGGETTEGQEVADCCDGKEDSKRNSSASGDSDSGSGSGGGGGCDGGSGNSGVCHPVHLFGFSKGGVVLNQLLAEAAEVGQMLTAQVPYSERLGKTEDRLGKIDSLSKIPPPALAVPASIAAAQAPAAAAAAAAAAAPAAAAAAADSPPPFSLPDPSAACATCSKAVMVRVHGTPRQWEDRRRPWIGNEKQRFVELLKDAMGQIKRNADAAPPSLRHHMTKRQRNAITAKEKLHWLKMQDSQPDLSNRALAKLAKVQPCQIREWKKMKERLEVASSCRRLPMPAEELQAAAHEEDATEEDAEAAAAEEEGVVLEEGGEAEEPSDDEWWRPGRYDREQCDEWHAGDDSE
ncbi:unnamed protein product [Closterium sp. NIES-64]|nr:unnamed protein product [Closterium sp. NIES-64]